MNGQENNTLQYVWLAVGLLLMLFVGGPWSIPAAAWLANVFLIRFSRSSKNWLIGPVCLWLGLSLVATVAWHNITPLRHYGWFAEPLMFTVLSIFSCVPFVLDRIFFRRWAMNGQSPFWVTLVFPVCFTAIDFIMTSGGPLGSFGAVGYSQSGFESFVQLAAVTGLYGFPFVIGWFGSVANYAWEHGFKWKSVKQGVSVYGTVLAIVLGFGMVRLAMNQPSDKEVMVGGFSLPRERLNSLLGTINNADEEAIQEAIASVNEDQLDQIRKMAGEGAKIVTLQEGAGVGFRVEIEKMLVDVAAVAKEEQVYVVLPTATLSRSGEERMENVVRIFDPNGEMVLEHFKYGGADFEGCVPGSGELQVAETPYGKIGAIICWDADFPDIVKQAGEKEIDLLFVPANDWVEIRDLHSSMASFRAVENGMPIFRQTGGGVSSVTDAFGRTINRIDVFDQEQTGEWAGVQLVNVPIGSTNTFFPQAGNKFGLLMFVSMVGLIGSIWLVRKPRDA